MADFGGRYRLDRCLGAGGMGKVWLAYDEELADRPVAIKVMRAPADEAGLARFQREMRLASRMHHPNIMTVFTTGCDRGVPFMVMEYLQGRDLGKMRCGWSASDVAQIGREACRALSYAHGLDPGVVHRDIKPGNLFICDTGMVKVTDFGLAKAVTETGLSAAGTVYGTMPYISPEQWLGAPATFSDDIWALGCVLYELLAGRLPRPYTVPADHLAAAARREHAAPLPDIVPAGLADAVMAMLHPDPGSRPTAGQAVALLTARRARHVPVPVPSSHSPVIAGPWPAKQATPSPRPGPEPPWTGPHAAQEAGLAWTGAHDAVEAPAAQRQPVPYPLLASAEPAAQARELPDGQGRRRLLIAAIAGAGLIGAVAYGTISGFTGPGRGAAGSPPRVQGTAAAASVPSPDPGAARKIAYQMMPSLGFNQTTQYSCLVALWAKLSGWDVYAGNESGGYGIPQATPGDIMASAGADWRTDAATQIKWGLGYIKETYDTPCGAWQYLQSHGSY
jgi:Protein kinase domain